ncbi:hypothetical protein M3205_24780, partial [Cytobacillus firmus]|uniref:hypothetical protein n=1 Tax=Cytobacillus firmus TaxID=1399 RepID=UPI00203F3C4A
PLNWIMFRKHINHLKHCITSILNQKRLPTSTIFIEFVDSLKEAFRSLFFIFIKSINYILKNKPGSTARLIIYRFSKLPT